MFPVDMVAPRCRKSLWPCVPTYQQFGAENASSSHKCDLDILCIKRDQFNATHSNCKHKDNWRKNRAHKYGRLRLQGSEGKQRFKGKQWGGGWENLRNTQSNRSNRKEIDVQSLCRHKNASSVQIRSACISWLIRSSSRRGPAHCWFRASKYVKMGFRRRPVSNYVLVSNECR